MSVLVSKVFRSTYFLLLATLIKRGFLFVLNLILIRYLPQESYGIFSTVRNTVSTFEGVSSSTLSSITIREVASKGRANFFQLALINIIVSIVAFIILLLFYSLNKDLSLNFTSKNNSYLLFFSLVLYLLILASNLLQSIIIGFEEYKSLLAINFISVLLTCVLGWFVWKELTVACSVLLLSAYYFWETALKFFYIRSRCAIDFILGNFFSGVANKLLASVSTVLLASVITSFSLWFVRIDFIKQESGLTGIANFDACFQLLTVVMIITGVTTSVFLPLMSKSKYSNTIWINIAVNSFVTFFLGTVIYIYKSDFLIFLGQDYVSEQNEKVVSILLITSFFFTFSSAFNKYFIARSRERIILFVSILSSITILTLSQYFIENSVVNLASSFLCFYLINTCFYLLFYSFKRVNNYE